jgi:hypothetical protein
MGPGDAPKADSSFIDDAVDNTIARVMELAEREPWNAASGVASGIGGMLVGAAMIAWALGWIGSSDGAPQDLLVAAGGVFVAGVGYLTVAVSLQWGEAVLRAGWRATLILIVFIYNWLVFTASLEVAKAVSIGPMRSEDLARVTCVALDIYVVLALCRDLVRQLAGRTGGRRHRLVYAGLAIAAALALHFTGALLPLYARLGVALPGPAATVGKLVVWPQKRSAPALPLESYVGAWYSGHKGVPGGRFGSSWLARIEVSVAGGTATARIWRGCPNGECDAGTFPISIEARRPGSVQALHVVGQSDGMNWIVTVTPLEPGTLLMYEERIHGDDWASHQEVGAVLRLRRGR